MRDVRDVVSCHVCTCARRHARCPAPSADVYPLVAAVAFGVSFGIYKGVEHLFSPDVQISPATRSTQALDKFSPEGACGCGDLCRLARGAHAAYEACVRAAGEAWRERVMRHYRHKDDSLRNLSMFEVLSPKWWQHRRDVAENPQAATAGGRTTLQ